MSLLSTNVEHTRTGYIVQKQTMWLTPTNGFPVAAANDLEAFMPTLRHPGIPIEMGGNESRRGKVVEV